MSSKLEPVIWLRVLVTLAYMKGRTDVRTDVHDVMAIKPNLLTSMGYHIFLIMVLRVSGASLISIMITTNNRVVLIRYNNNNESGYSFSEVTAVNKIPLAITLACTHFIAFRGSVPDKRVFFLV